jgi:flavin-dependent dehydrogenase
VSGTRDVDVVVVGGGISGSALATTPARSGSNPELAALVLAAYPDRFVAGPVT